MHVAGAVRIHIPKAQCYQAPTRVCWRLGITDEVGEAGLQVGKNCTVSSAQCYALLTHVFPLDAEQEHRAELGREVCAGG